MNKKTCIVITGPTAVGKTAAAIQLALHYKTDIISADSRQCYREMNIGVAKPSPQDLALVKHYFINSHSIHQEVTAAGFEQYALAAADEIFQKTDLAIMVGGTGLYIKAFCEGLDAIPAIDPAIRQLITQQYETNGIEWLQKEVEAEDPVYFATGEIHNPQRLMRALEVKRATGQSIRVYQQGTSISRDFNIVKIGLELPRNLLHERINARVDAMMQEGLLEEVKLLFRHRTLTALQTVGYKELFAFLDGGYTLSQAVELIKSNTRQYAKRQITWFKKAGLETSFDARQTDALFSYVENVLQRNL